MNLESNIKQIIKNVLPESIEYKIRKRRNRSKVDTNLLIITLDSCRFDVFEEAFEEELPIKNIRKAYSPACWTLPSHESIIRGMLPFGNFVNPLDSFNYDYGLRIPEQHEYSFGSTSIVYLSEDTLIDNDMYSIFDDYYCSQDLESADKLLKKAGEFMKNKNNFFGLINLGETHLPYSNYNEKTGDEMLQDIKEGKVSKEEALELQERACSKLLEKISDFRTQIPENTLVIVTADHGDLLGENGGYGHNPTKEAKFDDKLFEVPLIYWYE